MEKLWIVGIQQSDHKPRTLRSEKTGSVSRFKSTQLILIDCQDQSMEEKKKDAETYATDDPTDTTAEEQEDMAKEAIRKFKSLN